MSECTTCSYYGKHLEGRAEDMPWPCAECAGGEKYVERGKRKHQVPLRVQLAELLARHTALVEYEAVLLGKLGTMEAEKKDYNALVEAVAWERECEEIRTWLIMTKRYPKKTSARWELYDEFYCARAEVDRLLGEAEG